MARCANCFLHHGIMQELLFQTKTVQQWIKLFSSKKPAGDTVGFYSQIREMIRMKVLCASRFFTV